VALAAVIKGNDTANYLVGTSTDDAIYGYGGADRIHARGGPDALHLGGGKDRGHAKRGDDYISAVDVSEDFISCGPALIGPEQTLGTTSRRGVRKS
jgi:Ca2+-binding RTX toxin-like protein